MPLSYRPRAGQSMPPQSRGKLRCAPVRSQSVPAETWGRRGRMSQLFLVGTNRLALCPTIARKDKKANPRRMLHEFPLCQNRKGGPATIRKLFQSNAAARRRCGRNVMDRAQALSYQQHVVHGGNDGEGEGRAQKRQPRYGNPS